jgi:hypothetical protein
VAGTYADKTRSEFGEFVRTQDVILREGLLGGVLSTAWPMLDLDARKAKVGYEGKKKIDNRQLLTLSYRPMKATDLPDFPIFRSGNISARDDFVRINHPPHYRC